MWATVLGIVMGPIVDAVTKMYAANINKQISIEEFRTRVKLAVEDSFKEVAKSDNEAITKTYAAFMEAATKSRLMQVVWALVTVSQLLVLLWHQIGIPALVYLTGTHYPSSGSLVDWAYGLLGFCIGAGPLVLKVNRTPPKTWT